MTDNILESNLEIVFTMSYRFFRIWRSETMLRFKLIPDHLKLFIIYWFTTIKIVGKVLI